MAKMSINEIVKIKIASGEIKHNESPQGVTKERISSVLQKMHRESQDIRDVVLALLDEGPSWFSAAPKELRFCDGASTAHLGAHIAILQRGSDAKLDREGRDYWIKPLIEVGAIEPCYLPSKNDKELMEKGFRFYPGHIKAKSPNSGYRLAPSFVEILKAENWEELLNTWLKQDAVRRRLELQAIAASEAKKLGDNSHTDLIQASINHYVPTFLPGFEVLYVDDGDGDRISQEQQKKLSEAGLTIKLGDAMPDVLLVNRELKKLWVIEAVTSDGEVDIHKVSQMTNFAKRHGYDNIGFTTTYPSWKKLAERQTKTKANIAVNTFIWVLESGSTQLEVQSLIV